MNIWTKIQMKLINFWRKYKNIIIVVLILWGAILAINYFLKFRPKIETPKTTYTPNISVVTEGTVPEKVQSQVDKMIEEFVGYANKKDYEKAYNMITDECKQYTYPTIEPFKTYIDQVFPKKKIYNIQSYSSMGKTYVYNVRFLDDILATGITSKDYMYYEEKFVFQDTQEGMKVNMGGFIGKQSMNVVAEDQYMKVNIYQKIVRYDIETYYMKLTNRTSHPIVLMDNSISNEIALDIGDQKRNMETDGDTGVILAPGQTVDIGMPFTKYADDGRTAKKLIFNSVRVLNSYTGTEETRQQELDNAVKLYSMNITLTK